MTTKKMNERERRLETCTPGRPCSFGRGFGKKRVLPKDISGKVEEVSTTGDAEANVQERGKKFDQVNDIK